MTATSTGSFVSRRRSCRLCDSSEVVLVLPIKPSPIADLYVREDQLDRPQPVIPLDLYQCQSCGHVQNLDIVDPRLLFSDYIFHTSNSAGLVKHFEKYADEVTRDFALPPDSLVVEIGSNDGTLLRFFRDRGMRVIGVDPARQIANEATAAGLPTINDFFSSSVASRICAEHGRAALVVANNVYAHVDQLGDITAGIASLLDVDGIFVFEVSYLLDIIDKFLFDTVYHEHLSYHSITPLVQFLERHGLALFDVQRIGSKGGSIRGFAQLGDGKRATQSVVAEMVADEAMRGLHSPAIFRDYERRISQRKQAVRSFLDDAREDGKTIATYGASNTVTTLMYHFEIVEFMSYMIDDNTRKHGLFSPGSHLKVKPSTVLYDDPPDVVVVMAWQFAEPIMAQHRQYVTNGGQFAVPLPRLRIVGPGQ